MAGTGPMNLFLTLGRHRRLFLAWLHFAARLMPGGRLPRRDTEMVILRVAHLCGCEYERVQHTRLARRAGLDEADLARIERGPDAPGWTDREQAILAAVDALHRDDDLDWAAWSELRTHLDEQDCIELCLLAGHYRMLAATIKALRIQPEGPAEGAIRSYRTARKVTR
ncbi:MAG TPA: carboxymuconolactone decarboxylase family protein [Acidimicrobiales bacterium]|nr:carboxymuconolactone decarboxylase family protein [Acidimicrobiales bacterium]